jgi:DNA-binding SARP family transcriptional activator/tetratricopeptide (TPR) repeat protein
VAALEFGLLGPLVVRRDGTVLIVRRGNQRTLLATLLLRANQVVSSDQIAGTLWGPTPPPSAQVSIRNYVKRLRQALGDEGRARIRTEPSGYLIGLEPGELDLAQFEHLLRSAQLAARDASWEAAAADAASALLLWRGEPLADVESDALRLREGPRLSEMRLQALETRIDADVHLGGHAEVTVELQRLTSEHPMREQLHALLMLALYRCGRQGEALAAYRHARGLLADELGVDPGPALRELHQQILTADPALALSPPARQATALAAGTPAAGSRVPRQLPRTIAQFVGRTEELAVLTAMMGHAAGTKAPGTLVIGTIGGTAGVGKTALAVHWAHQAAHRFPGGQLYVDLRGFDPSGTPLSPADAIRGLLDALGVPASQIPSGLDAQAGLYRSVLADQQVLIVLDNAHDEQQVRPLLPAAPGCLVIITSRNQLTGLAAADNARMLTLDILTHAEAREMLATRLSETRAAGDPGAVAHIVGLCARLPLALAITAAGAAVRPRLPLASLAAEIRDAASPLDALDTGDPAASIRAVFSWSYHQLSPSAARTFRLLGLHPGPNLTAPAAASLTGVSVPEAHQALGELARAHLIFENSAGRYGFHDLLRAYATEVASSTETGAEQREATGRLLDHYVHTAKAAALMLSPSREPITLIPPRPAVSTGHFASRQEALAWFEAEQQVLLGAVALAANTGFDACAWQLPWAIAGFLDRRGHWHEWAAVQRTALAAANRLSDAAGEAAARRSIGHACTRLGDYAQARGHATAALDLYLQLGKREGQARVHQDLCWQATQRGRYADALGHAEQAFRLFRELADRAGQANALNSLGWCHAMLGDPARARTFCQRAIAVSQELGHRQYEGHGWDSLGNAEQLLGHHDAAAECYLHAIAIFQEARDRYNEADALIHLGGTRQAGGDGEGAEDAWRQALAILDDLQHGDAAKVRARLASHQQHWGWPMILGGTQDSSGALL